MYPLPFKFQNHVYAKTTRPIPAFKSKTASCEVVTCWGVGILGRLKILITGKIWVLTETHQKPLQRFILTQNRKDVVSLKKDKNIVSKLKFWD